MLTPINEPLEALEPLEIPIEYIIISIEYKTKDLIKLLGCKWNVKKKYWYCPDTNTRNNILRLIDFQNKKILFFTKRIYQKQTEKRPPGTYTNFSKHWEAIEYYSTEEIHKIFNIK